MSSLRASVIVVGAGMAGLSAAQHLFNAGFTDVQILEASDRLGGRVHTYDIGDHNGRSALIELGANFIHGTHGNAVYSLATEHNLLSPFVLLDRMGGCVYTEDGRRIDQSLTDRVWKIFHEVEKELEDIVSENTDPSADVGRYMEDRLQERLGQFAPDQQSDIRALLNCMLNYLSLYSAEDLEKVSLKYIGCYREIDGKNVILPNGFRSIIDVIAQDLPPNTLRFNTKVEKISYLNTKTVTVSCQTPSGKRTFEANHAIVTCSLGVLKSCHSDMFEPPLPTKKVKSIDAIGYGTLNKIFLKWKEPFWQRGEGCMQFAWKTRNTASRTSQWYKSLFGFIEILNNDSTLCGWIHGKAAEHLETLTDQEVMTQCVTLIRQFRGDPKIPAPTEILRSAWQTNEFTRGSYSFLSQMSSPEDIACLGEPLYVEEAPVVLFAGEATHPHFFSTTHGARESGIREAERLENFYQKQLRH